MKRRNSLVFRLTAMVFVLLFITIAVLLFLVNSQMDSHFSQYLQMNDMMGHMNGMMMDHHMMRGEAEEHYIASVHQSLIWVGMGMLAISVTVSYFVVRSIIGPLRKLTDGVYTIQHGKYGQTVPVNRSDEVGLLAESFNAMSLQLQKNDSMRRQLFAGVAHELRTPLAILQGNLEGMIDNVIVSDKTKFLSMEDEILRLNRLVRDLRDLSLAEINELVLHKELSDVNMLLRRAASMLQPLTDEKRLAVSIDLDETIPAILIDRDRINQVIYNILNNAVRYINEGDTIQVATHYIAEHDEIEIIISDTGPGIPKEDLSHIFRYFYRGEKSRNRKSGGSGIGLALAQQYVLCHDGTIEVESELGLGTSFRIHLPVAEQANGNNHNGPHCMN